MSKEEVRELIEKFRDPYNKNTEADAKHCALIATKLKYHALREQLFELRSVGIIQSGEVYLKRLTSLIDDEVEMELKIEKYEQGDR